MSTSEYRRPSSCLTVWLIACIDTYYSLTELGLILAGLVWIPYGVLISASMMVFNVSEKGYYAQQESSDYLACNLTLHAGHCDVAIDQLRCAEAAVP